MVFENDTVLRNTALPLVGIGTFIYLPVGLYSLYRYFIHRNHVILKKHYAEINQYMVTSSLFVLCFMQFFILIIGKIISEQLTDFATIPLLSFSFITSILFAWRCYMNYYCINYSNALDSDHWKQLINPSTSTNNWFIINKHQFGNYKYFYKHVVIACLSYIAIVIALRLIFSAQDEQTVRLRWLTMMSLPAVTTLVIISFISYIYCKTPKYGDIFYIHQELRLMIMIFLVGIGTMCVFAVADFFVVNMTVKIGIRLFMAFDFATIFIIGIVSQTLFVIYKNKKWLLMVHMDQQGSALNIEYELTKAKSLSAISISTNNNKCAFDDVLSDKNGFDSFMFHLSKEFSTEILLSLLEITQYKQYIVNYYGDDQQTWDTSKCIKWPQTSKSFPKSYVVYNELDDKYKKYCNSNICELMIRAFILYEKYVARQSPFEINVSSSVRRRLINIMGNFEEWMLCSNLEFKTLNNDEKLMYLYEIFDECMYEMISLLKNSFTRYKQTLLYDEFRKLWNKKLTKIRRKHKLLNTPSTRKMIGSDSDCDSPSENEQEDSTIVVIM